MWKRFIWCTIWILGVVLVSVSLDSTPDPPALDPHAQIVKVAAPSGWPLAPGSQLERGGSLSLLRQQTAFFEADTDPHSPIALLTEAGQASDTSPPA
jgi:hypothetical protein